MLHIEAIPAFEDNYIWLILDPSRRYAAIVDPGDAEPVLEYLQTKEIQPCAILITHHHGDHTGGIKELLAHYDIPVYGPAHERITGVSRTVKEGDIVELEPLQAHFQVIDVPGHTRGHVSYYGHGALFCGDTLFTAGCGRLFEGSAEQMSHSLAKLAALPDETLVYCAHEYTQDNLRFARVAEPENADIIARVREVEALRLIGKASVPAPLAVEKQTNPFLRTHLPNVIHAAESFSGKSLSEIAEVFAVVRQWKDSLD